MRDQLVAHDTPRVDVTLKNKESMTPRDWADLSLDQQNIVLQCDLLQVKMDIVQQGESVDLAQATYFKMTILQ